MIESAYYIAKNSSTLHAFRVELWLSPTRFLQENPEIHDIPHVLLPDQYLLGRGGCTRKLYKRYKNATQTHFSWP